MSGLVLSRSELSSSGMSSCAMWTSLSSQLLYNVLHGMFFSWAFLIPFPWVWVEFILQTYMQCGWDANLCHFVKHIHVWGGWWRQLSSDGGWNNWWIICSSRQQLRVWPVCYHGWCKVFSREISVVRGNSCGPESRSIRGVLADRKASFSHPGIWYMVAVLPGLDLFQPSGASLSLKWTINAQRL